MLSSGAHSTKRHSTSRPHLSAHGHRARALAVWLAAPAALLPAPASAHFVLVTPDSWAAQDNLGLPEKSAPCGQADPGTPAVPSGAVTALRSGQTITVTINEMIFHPGHYRIALAADQASLPDDPPVTAGATPCGSTTVEANPTLPVIADGLFVHTTPFAAPQSVQVQLPPGMTCDHCVLQVIEFMGDHGLNNPGGCFYHHCANVTITTVPIDAGAADSGAVDAGPTSAADAAAPLADAAISLDASLAPGADLAAAAPIALQSGCSCRVSAARLGAGPRAIGLGGFGLCLAALALRGRRRRGRRG